MRRTLLGVSLTTLYTWTGIRMQMGKLGESAPRWICTEAIIVSLLKALPEFEAVNRMELDYHTLGFATTNDFLRIAKRFPDILAIEQGS